MARSFRSRAVRVLEYFFGAALGNEERNRDAKSGTPREREAGIAFRPFLREARTALKKGR